MNYTWEIVDVIAGRRVWAHNRANNGESIIGFDSSIARPDRYCLISLTDGMVYSNGCTIATLATVLNDHGYRPAEVRLPDIQPEKR